MAFNNWPYTNFQDLNLGWILAKVKEAFNKATEALSSTTGFDARITTAETNSSEANTNASQALSTANTADGKATEALSTANNASDTANTASANATQARTDSATALTTANQALSYVAGVKGTCRLDVSGNTVTYNDAVQNGADIHDLFLAGNYPYCVYDDGEGTRYIYKPDVYVVLGTIYTQSFTCITPSSAAGEDYELLKRLVIINGVPQFATDVELASTDYVDSHGGGGSTDAVLYTAQTLASAQKRQARSNIGAGKSTVTVSNSVMTIVDADTGSQNAYPIGGTGDLPTVSTADNGKFLRVVSGAWAAASVPSAESTEFGP